GSGTLTLTYTITAADASVLNAQVQLNLATAEGVDIAVPLDVTVIPLLPQLSGPSALQAGMVQGEQSTWEFQITNNGGLATGPIQLLLPAASFLSAANGTTLPSLDPGATEEVDLLLAPAADLPVGPYTGTIVLQATGTSLTIPFTFTNVSSATADLQVTVQDENSFYGAGNPNLQGATVTLSDPFTGDTIYQATTDATGILTIPNLPQ